MKRIFDIVAAATALIVLWPLIAILWVMVRLNLGTPSFFRQVRLGQDAVPFQMIKFRTMLDIARPDGVPAPDAERLTGFGRLLRATSLDELPELWNVLAGNMSLVGPRPLLPEYLPLYSSFQNRRHEVRPGLTGWAQVNGRNALTWEERFELDVWYVDHHSLWLDLKIICRTVLMVMKGHGVTAAGDATMPRFVGTSPDVKDHE